MTRIRKSTGPISAGIFVAAAALAIFSFRYLFTDQAVSPQVLANMYARPWLYLHVACSATALLVGAAQFTTSVRRVLPTLHRYVGRIYVVVCLAGSVSGLVLAIGATAGPIAGFGFGSLAIAWAVCTGQAWRLAVAGRIVEHRRWAIRSWALTLSAITFRAGIFGLPYLGVEYMDGYRISAVAGWLLNLCLAEAYLSHDRANRRVPTNSGSSRHQLPFNNSL